MADARKQQALFPTCYADDEEIMRKAAHFGVVGSDATSGVPAHAATEVLPPSEIWTAKQIPIFDSFMRMGLVPPFFDFFLEILRAYRLKLLHLTPIAILYLTVFAYACESFVGVMPSVALFRHFFYPRIGKDGWLGGVVMFCFRPKVKQDYPEMVVKSKWDEWRNRWFLVEVPEALPYLNEPKEHPVNLPTWRSLSP